MGFKISENARKWFKHVAKKDKSKTDIDQSKTDKIRFGTDFDIYYFCLMAGLAARRKETPKDVNEFIDYYPSDYKKSGKLLVSLLIKAELDCLSVDLTEKKNVRDVIKRLVSVNSGSYLSDEGMKLMDSYSYAGFDVIREAFHNDPPRSLEIFLPRFRQILQNTCN